MAANYMHQLFQRMGFTLAAATAVVDNEGFDELAMLQALTEDGVKALCVTVRKPGGLMPNPDHPGGAGAAQPALIPYLGRHVSAAAEGNLKLAVYWLHFRQKTSRPTNPGDVTLDNIRTVQTLKRWEDNYKEPDIPTDLINPKDWPKSIDMIKAHLRGHLGITGIPLAYVVRETEAPQEDPEEGFTNQLDEMIARAPIAQVGADGAVLYNATYLMDRERVWDIISTITQSHECWAYAKKGQRRRDGRVAFKAIYDHYLGPNSVDNQATSAEAKLKETTYSGEKRNWNFEKYVRVHEEQYQILANLARDGHHAGLDEHTRVRYLMEGIKTTSFDTVRATIIASAELHHDFTRCVSLYSDFIKHSSTQPRMNVSALGSAATAAAGDSKRVSFPPIVTLEDRYYTAVEYQRLSKEQRKQLHDMRSKRPGGKPPGRSRNRPSNGRSRGNNMHLSKRSIKAIATALREPDNDPQDDPSDNEEESNRTNPALTRQKIKKPRR